MPDQAGGYRGLVAAELWGLISQINQRLEAQEPNSISIEEARGKRKELQGYQVQYVIDAVNSILGPASWCYEVHSIEDEEKGGMIAEVSTSFYVEGEWLCKGRTFGGGQSAWGKADGKKSAIADALKKSLAMWSVGNKAYKGEVDEEEAEENVRAQERLEREEKKKTRTSRSSPASRSEASTPPVDPPPAEPPATESTPPQDPPAEGPAEVDLTEPLRAIEGETIKALMANVTHPDGGAYFDSGVKIADFFEKAGYGKGMRVRDLPRWRRTSAGTVEKTLDVIRRVTGELQQALQGPAGNETPLAGADAKPWTS